LVVLLQPLISASNTIYTKAFIMLSGCQTAGQTRGYCGYKPGCQQQKSRAVPGFIFY